MVAISPRHLIIIGTFFVTPPSLLPPKICDFGGGISVLNKIVNFRFYEIEELLVKI
jgi:hypothetical protein